MPVVRFRIKFAEEPEHCQWERLLQDKDSEVRHGGLLVVIAKERALREILWSEAES